MKDYKEVFVGQIFKDQDNGEPDIKVLEIDRGLADKYPDLSCSGAQHGLDDGIDVRYSLDGEDESIADYIDFLDFTYSNSYEPTKKSPNGTGNMEPEYKREEDETNEASIPANLQKKLSSSDFPKDYKCCEGCWAGEEEDDLEIKTVPGPNEWPNSNTPGNCWCGHEELKHASIHLPDQQACAECQCVNFTLDRWAK